MEALLEAIAKLFGVFKDPVNVILLLLVCGLSFSLYKAMKFIADRYDADIKSRSDFAAALNNFTQRLGNIEDNVK